MKHKTQNNGVVNGTLIDTVSAEPEGRTVAPSARNGVLAASLLLPGIAAFSMLGSGIAHADLPPEKSTLGFQLGSYHDEQPGWSRITAVSPQLYWQTPVGEEHSVTIKTETDAVSGASPRLHSQSTAISGASRMHENRLGADVKVSRYLARSTLSTTLGTSRESDYRSNSLAFDGRWSSDDNNTTWSAGVGLSEDSIGKDDALVKHQRHTSEVMGGVTQILSPVDIAQLNLTVSQGRGYFTDPYKSMDSRPDQRDAKIGLARWNHHFEDSDLTLRSSYRYYTDTFGIRSHTFGFEWDKTVGSWTFRPELRYYSQSKADFYLNPAYDTSGQYSVLNTLMQSIGKTYYSADPRLSAFGALTTGLGLAYAYSPGLTLNFKYSSYRQRSSWALQGQGSPGIDPFSAKFMQIGFVYKY